MARRAVIYIRTSSEMQGEIYIRTLITLQNGFGTQKNADFR
jgi:hypothetical protein